MHLYKSSFDSLCAWEQEERSSSPSSKSTSSSNESQESSSENWKTSAKCWGPDIWSRFYGFLYEQGYRLHTSGAVEPSMNSFSNIEDYWEDLKEQLAHYSPYDCLRTAHDLVRNDPDVFVKAIIPKHGSREVEVLKLLNQKNLLRDTRNYAVDVLDVIEVTYQSINIVFIVQRNGGQPLFELDTNALSTAAWTQLVLKCFEGLEYLHCNGIAHLDIGPANIVYDSKTCRPSFIDFEGCQLHEGNIQEARSKGSLLAVNARLPELADPAFDPFAADVWELGDTFLQEQQMNRFPDDDLTAIFRFMTLRHPPARPTISYALGKLRSVLSSCIDAYY